MQENSSLWAAGGFARLLQLYFIIFV